MIWRIVIYSVFQETLRNKINSEVCVRDGEEYIPTHCHETQLKKTGITSLEHIDTLQTVRAIKKKKRKGKEKEQN